MEGDIEMIGSLVIAAFKRKLAIKATRNKQLELQQSFNQRVKFQVWNKQTDLGGKWWNEVAE